MKKQVNKDHYNFDKYLGLDRWSSYHYQLREILKLKPQKILEIGIGDGIVGNYLKNYVGIDYKSLDLASDLKPDFLGSIDQMPLNNNSYDLVCAFEVLEHLPYEKFEKSLIEIKRVSSKYAIISLPHFGPSIKLKIKIPFLSEISFAFKIPYPKKHYFNGEHYWEIGKKGYSVSLVRKKLKKHFEILKEFVPFENQYHHFYILEKISNERKQN